MSTDASAASDKVLIFDTTLRDGEQSPGATMNLGEKLEVAQALALLGVDVIEAGFPAASAGDLAAVQAIAERVGNGEQPVTICALARCTTDDIGKAWEAVRAARSRRIHVFLATSTIHREHKLKMTVDELLATAVEGVERARALCDDVEFSPEDASRTDREMLAEVVERVIDAGATTVNIPDTVGYAVPEQFAATIAYLRKHVRNIGRARISVHCHDDLGLAVANSLAAVRAGARQVECTVNGLGERAGNCSLEEVVMAIRTRSDYFSDVHTTINTRRLYPTSRLVSSVTGLPVPRNKAVVGQNAFAHESGIHQHGMLMHHSTYEIMRPDDVGLVGSRLVLGKHSGRHALRDRLAELGYQLDEPQLNRLFDDFKVLAEKKKEIFDADLALLVEGRITEEPGPWKIVAVQTSAGTGTLPTATVCLTHSDGRRLQEAACGDGPVDAVLKAIERIAEVDVRLRDYQVRSASSGKDAQGEVYVEIEHQGKVHRSRAASTDILEASARAFVQVLNRIVAEQQPAHAILASATRRD